jgi:hypothetical protein
VVPEGSLACPQEPTTGLYPEPDKSGPYPPSILFHVNLILRSVCGHFMLQGIHQTLDQRLVVKVALLMK